MAKKLKHTHSNHLPRLAKKKILKIESVAKDLRIGKTNNHRHNGTPFSIQFQRETPNGWNKLKLFIPDGTIDLFVLGNKNTILEAL